MEKANSRITVLILSSDYKPNDGGVAEFMFHVAKALSIAGLDVHLLAPAIMGSEAFDNTFPEVKTHRLPKMLGAAKMSFKRMVCSPFEGIKMFLAWQRQLEYMKYIILKYGITGIVCFQWDPYALLAMRIKRWLGLPYAVVAHGSEIRHRRRDSLWMLRNGWQWILQYLAMSAADVIVTNSEYTKTRVKANVPKGKTFVVTYCGVDSNKYRPGPKSVKLVARHQLECKKVLLSMGRLVRRKGIDNTLAALERHWRKEPDSELVYLIGGRGPDEGRLREIVNKMGAGDRVRFLGYVDENEKCDYYNLADAFIMVSREEGDDVEGFGIVYAEASSCGKPVIGGASGGVPSVVKNGITGLLVNPGDISEIQAAIEGIVGNEEYGRLLGRNGRRMIEIGYSWTRIGEKFVDLVKRMGGE